MPEQTPQRRYVFLLAVIASAILGFGTLLKPEKKAPQVTISEAEKARLQRLTQRKSLQDMTSYFAGVARDAAPHLVRLNEVESSGVVWNSAGLIVTAGAPDRFPQSVSALGARGAGIRVEPAAFFSSISLVALQAPEGAGLQPVSKAAPSALEPGSWIVQVSLGKEGRSLFAQGVYTGTMPSACGDFRYQEVQTSLPLNRAIAGGGLFDMDGNLLAVVLSCGQRPVAVAPEDVQAAIDSGNGFDGKLLHRYGMRVSALNDEAAAYFKVEEGAVVTEVWKGRRADVAGLKPGDVIVKLDDEPVKGPDDLARLVLPAVYPAVDLGVQRGRRSIRITLPASESDRAGRNDNPNASGIQLQSPQQGYLIASVEPGSRADRAGIQPGDRLLEVNGRQLTSLSTARRVLSANNAQPTHVVVERGPRRIGLTLK